MNAENLAEGSWALVMFSGGWKFHYCPSEIVSDLVADIIARGGEEKEIKVVVEGRIDLPGMIMTDRPWESIKIGSFNLNIPSQDFSEFMIELASAPVRKFASGKEYYKIHSWRECVVFSPEQREMVLDVAEKMIDNVNKRADKADEEFSNCLANINKNGLKVISARDKKSPYVKRVAEPKKENN